MATGKRYYWIKLKESFMTSDIIDYFMSQTEGANYVVLYQMLCLKTINTNGRLSRKVGEIIIPYDIPKIQRDLKWFSTDTISAALNLYKASGLMYEDVDGVLVLADHNSLVGSETDWAAKKQHQRLESGGDNVPTNVPTNVPQSVPIDIDNRDRDKDIDIDRKNCICDFSNEKSPPKEKTKTQTKEKRFSPPSPDDVKAYCKERGNSVDAERFVSYYTSNGWKVGRNNMKDWKAAVRTWERPNDSTSNRADNTPDFKISGGLNL